MKIRFLLVAHLLFAMLLLFAGNLGRIEKLLEKGEYEKAEKSVRKSLEKSPNDPGLQYFLSKLFLTERYTLYNIDSAYVYYTTALSAFGYIDTDKQVELDEVHIDSTAFAQLFSNISDKAFARAEGAMTVDDLQLFLDEYPGASGEAKATFLRDSLAFNAVSKVNTWEAYKGYMEIYSASSFYSRAEALYQQLIFQSYTADGRLESYIKFVDDFPKSPFRDESEQVIFDLSTKNDEWDSYKWFLLRYPESNLQKKVGDILYYKSLGQYRDSLAWLIDLHVASDSLRSIDSLREKVLIPIYEEGKYGFMDLDANLMLSPLYADIDKQYICGGITDDWLQVRLDSKPVIVNRKGDILVDGASSFQQISASTYLVMADEPKLYHAAGNELSEHRIVAARELSNGWIAFKKDYNWGIMLPNGRDILTPDFNSIAVNRSLVVIEKEGLFAISTEKHILQGEPLSFEYDDYEVLNDTLLFVYKGDEEALFDHQLNSIYPFTNARIRVQGDFIYSKQDSLVDIIHSGSLELAERSPSDIQLNDGWLALMVDAKWQVLSRRAPDSVALSGLDSVRLLNDRSILIYRPDDQFVLFQNNTRLPVPDKATVERVDVEKDAYNSTYLVLREGAKSKVFGMNSQLLWQGSYQNITAFSDSVFGVSNGGKMALLDRNGDQLLPARYDLLDEEDGLVFLLRAGKIGGLDLHTNTTINSNYEARIERFDSGYYEVKTEGKLGIIKADGDFAIPADFDQIMQWNDSSAWIRSEDFWKLVTLDNEVLMEGLTSVRWWIDVGSERLAIVSGVGGYGLFSDKRGVLLPMEYNDIINVGSPEEPVFFAEQHLKAASLFVVTYFDIDGNALRSQAFQQKEYDKIYCDD